MEIREALTFDDVLLVPAESSVLPGESFGQAAAGHVRIALTVDDDALDAALAELLAFAAEIAP